jgi:hypothetical protein
MGATNPVSVVEGDIGFASRILALFERRQVEVAFDL